MMAEEELTRNARPTVVRRLAAASKEIAAFSDFRNAYRRPLASLARRIRLLAPMFDELEDRHAPLPDGALRSLELLEGALTTAKDLIRFSIEGSRIATMLDRDMMTQKFQDVSTQLEQALAEIFFDDLDISDEVQEQIELVKSQFQRARERIEMPDFELFADLTSLYNMATNENAEPATLERVAKGLQLMTISDLTQESLALHEMVVAKGGRDPDECIEQMSMLLKKIKDFVQTQYPEIGTAICQKRLHLNAGQTMPIIPDEFRCPISLDLMKDPVIVATGQTYERSCIEKWIKSGHETCPKTQQTLSKLSLIPNYVLRSLIAQWCEENGIELSKSSSQHHKPASDNEHVDVDALVHNLQSATLDEQRAAAGELRLLAKRSVGYRIRIAEAGAIPLFVSLLSSADQRTQEHAVTCLLNLSIYDENKASIIRVGGAIHEIIHVLTNGSMEARENAAAALFSLSLVDENKVLIGAAGAIPPLASLLSEGTHRGRKDAATAIFNLCIYQGNRAKAVSAGVVPQITTLLGDPAAAMVDESMAILALLSSHQEGKTAILAAKAVSTLVQMMEIGSPRNRENAAAILLNLSTGEKQLQCLSEAQECGIMGPLREIAASGTDRGKRKASQLLERMSRFLGNKQESEPEADESSADADMQSPVNVRPPNEQPQIPGSIYANDI